MLRFSPGLFSRELSAHVKSIVGVDISTKVVEEYNSQAFMKGLSDKLKAVSVELKVDDQLDGTTQQFDIVLVSLLVIYDPYIGFTHV